MNRMHLRLLHLRLPSHVGYDREAHAPPVCVGEIDAADTNRGTDAHQVRPCQQAALRYGAEIVDLQFDRGETLRAAKMAMECSADGRIGKARGDAAVKRSRGVQEFGADVALNGETVAVHANQFQSQQVIERMPGEKRSNERGRILWIAQVW